MGFKNKFEFLKYITNFENITNLKNGWNSKKVYEFGKIYQISNFKSIFSSFKKCSKFQTNVDEFENSAPAFLHPI